MYNHTRYIIIRVLFTFHRPLFLFLFKHFFSIRAPTRRTPLILKNDNPDSTQRCTRLRCPFFRSHGGSTRTTTPVVAARLALAHSSRRTSPLARFRTPSLQRAKRQRKTNERNTKDKRKTNERQRKRSVQSTVPRTSSVHFVPTVRPWSAKVQPIL